MLQAWRGGTAAAASRGVGMAARAFPSLQQRRRASAAGLCAGSPCVASTHGQLQEEQQHQSPAPRPAGPPAAAPTLVVDAVLCALEFHHHPWQRRQSGHCQQDPHLHVKKGSRRGRRRRPGTRGRRPVAEPSRVSVRSAALFRAALRGQGRGRPPRHCSHGPCALLSTCRSDHAT